MRAALFHEFKAPLTIETVPDPTPTPDGVVIAVKANGICRSDWHGWQGHDDDITTLPHIPGHELAGEVVAVGGAVRRWQVGDRVTVPFCLGCGTCEQCISGNHQVCNDDFQPGFTGPGAFAEYVALPYADVNLVRVPESLDFAEVASLGCRFVTAFRGVVAQGRLRLGEWLVVYGCGGVGLSAVMIGAAVGANVVAVDINPEALALAAQLGAQHTINAAEVDDVVAAVHTLTSGGAHVGMDALGHTVTCQNSILSLRKRGRHIQVGLMLDDHAAPAVPMGTVLSRELELIGSHGMQAHAYPELLRMIEAGVLNPAALITRRVSLDEAPAVLASMTTYATTGIVVIDQFS